MPPARAPLIPGFGASSGQGRDGGGNGGPDAHGSQAPAFSQGPLTRDPDIKFDRLFEDKVALNPLYAYTGKEGEKWAKTTRGYWLSRFPGIQPILEWLEEQEGREITEAVVLSAVEGGRFIHMEFYDML